jgi:fatty-acyl-CoA synthase
MIHGDLLGERARLTPDKLAVVDVATGTRLSYSQIDARAAACARAFRQVLGLARGDRVGLLAGNRLEYLDLVYAAGKSGIVLVPMGTRLTAHELEHIVRDSGLRALIYDRGFLDTIRALRELVDVERWIAIDDDRAREGDDRLDSLLRAVPATPWARERCAPEDLYALLYTSGTTGRPKGVMVPHRMVSWNAYNTVACWQLREDDVSPIFTPLYHAGALGAFLLPMVAIGGTVVLHAAFNTTEVWQTITRERCTVVLGVPTIWKMLLEAPEFETADVAHVRWFISGGAPLPEYIAEAFQARGVVFKQGYGLTEVGVNCFSMTVEESVRKRGSIGKPLMMTEARLVNEQGAEVEAGEVGELCLRGSHVSRGYWNDEEATSAALDAEGWFHTGDLARRDQEGFHYIAGRRKDMFISGGVNVYPAEIEAELLQHPDLADAAVVSVPHATWGEVGVAFVVVRPGRSADAAQLTRHLEGRLARYKLPKDFVVIDALPRTAYGKVQKGPLRDQYAQRHPKGDGAAPPAPQKGSRS